MLIITCPKPWIISLHSFWPLRSSSSFSWASRSLSSGQCRTTRATLTASFLTTWAIIRSTRRRWPSPWRTSIIQAASSQAGKPRVARCSSKCSTSTTRSSPRNTCTTTTIITTTPTSSRRSQSLWQAAAVADFRPRIRPSRRFSCNRISSRSWPRCRLEWTVYRLAFTSVKRRSMCISARSWTSCPFRRLWCPSQSPIIYSDGSQMPHRICLIKKKFCYSLFQKKIIYNKIHSHTQM